MIPLVSRGLVRVRVPVLGQYCFSLHEYKVEDTCDRKLGRDTVYGSATARAIDPAPGACFTLKLSHWPTGCSRYSGSVLDCLSTVERSILHLGHVSHRNDLISLQVVPGTV